MTESQDQPDRDRRSLLAGLGAFGGALGVGAAGGAFASPAAADDGPDDQPVVAGAPGVRASPVPASTKVSAPEQGVSYRFVTAADFTPEDYRSARRWNAYGVYTAEQWSTLWATVEIPRGAVVHDIEWYARNNNATTTPLLARYAVAGSGLPTVEVVDATLSSTGNAVVARKVAVPATHNGPHPFGTTLFVGLVTPVDGTVTIAGARVGFTGGPTQVSLLPSPIRAYDSRSSGGAVAPNSTRTINLSSAIPAGVNSALLSLSITGCVGRGTLRLGRGGTTPTATAIQWARTGDQVTTAATTQVSLDRRIAVRSAGSTGTTHVVVDVLGFLSS